MFGEYEIHFDSGDGFMFVCSFFKWVFGFHVVDEWGFVLVLIAAIQALKEDAMQCAKPNVQPVLEEFIPLKKDCDKKTGEPNNHKKEKDSRDKKNWMSSVQLWNTDNYHHPTSDFPCDRKRGSEIDSKVNRTKSLIEL